MTWEHFGYDAKPYEPCIVCSRMGGNKIEPRFLYVICEEHHQIPPARIYDDDC